MATKSRSRSKNGKARPLAKRLDKHVLYQLSVQGPESDSRFYPRLFKKITGRPLRVFREDFCGTAILSCHVVKNHRQHRAIGVDIHGPTLEWARAHNLSMLDEDQQSRIQLIQADVRKAKAPKADLCAALNFSYSIFRTRAEMIGYFKSARAGLVRDGVFVIDAWGGADTMLEDVDEREIDAEGIEGLDTFTYIWDQESFDPVTHRSVCKIHFEFEDGSRIRNAFRYEWRLWTLPELQEMLEEAGFFDVHVLWEGTDRETNEGNGVFRRVTKGEADPSWIAYLVASAGR